MTDLVILHPGGDGTPEAEVIRELAGNDATVVAIQVPTMSRRDLVDCHYQHGVDLARISELLRIRDIVLVKLPNPAPGRSQMALLHVWGTETSHYDLDAVRIPWDEIEGPRDKRNNPLGKNPTNLWAFGASLATRQVEAEQLGLLSGADEPADVTATSAGIEPAAIQRLARCHCDADGTVHVWAPDADADLMLEAIASTGRRGQRLPAGTPDERVPIEVAIAPAPTLDASGETLEWAASGGATAVARVMDCRRGIAELPRGSVTHAITSPPYNIGYDPFNVARLDARSGEMTAPERKGYEDSLPPDAYAGLMQSVFEALDDAASPDGFELFLNIKNNYKGGACAPPFYLLRLMPERWRLLDLLVWRYDISFDPARNKYKPVYEWVIRVGFGKVKPPERPMDEWYIPILKGNSRERRELSHPAMFPRDVVVRALAASGRTPGLVVDPFLGSGTTIAACYALGHDSIGFELSAEYADDIRQRIKWI